jgi:16S rRNA (cytosine1402-N4)-methyltransferase
MSDTSYHTPVLLQESVNGMNIKKNGTYIDLTFGGGGHSKEILDRLGRKGHLYGVDQDQDAINNIPANKKFTFVKSNFRHIANFMDYYHVDGVDGILGDLGVSSHHFDEAERGFSTRFDGPLDMRMNQKGELTAAKILNEYKEQQLADLFFYYGEIKNAKKLADKVCYRRQGAPLRTIKEFIEIAKECTPPKVENKYFSKGVQAIRIEVNQELEVLKEVLTESLDVLKPGGRLVVITYHSLEDRLVKNFFRTGNFEGKVEKDFYGAVSSPFELVNRKVIVPDAEELERNSRSRSAKLRIAIKK